MGRTFVLKPRNKLLNQLSILYKYALNMPSRARKRLAKPANNINMPIFDGHQLAPSRPIGPRQNNLLQDRPKLPISTHKLTKLRLDTYMYICASQLR